MAKGSYRKKVRRNQMIAAIIGFGITIVFVVTLVAPGSFSTGVVTVTPFANDSNNDEFQPPTATPRVAPTVPPEGVNVAMGETYLDPTGLFQFPEPYDPEGQWTNLDNPDRPPSPQQEEQATSNVQTEEIASTRFLSPVRLTIVHGTSRPADLYPNVDTLLAAHTDTYFDQVWSDFPIWERREETVTDQIISYEFYLVDDEQISYLARYNLWYDDGLINGLRLVVPENNAPLLDTLQEKILPRFIGYPGMLDDIDGQTAGWVARADKEIGYMVKLPPFWQVVEGGEGRARTVYSITFSDTGPVVRITLQQRNAVELESLEAARNWLQDNTTVDLTFMSDGEVVEQRFGSGYLLQYTYQNIDFDTFTGAMMLLNDAEGNLYTAELITDGRVEDFTAPTAHPNQQQAYTGLESFTLLAPAEYTHELQTFPETFITSIRHTPSRNPRTDMNNVLPGIFTSSQDGTPVWGYQ